GRAHRAPARGATLRRLRRGGARRAGAHLQLAGPALRSRGQGARLLAAGAMLESGAHALGCAVIPGGTGQSEQQVRTIADLNPAGYVGTPSFLAIILDKAGELGVDLSCLGKALVSGEAFPAALRTRFAKSGIAALQCYATADLGLIAYESVAGEGLILDEGVIVEIVHPGTGDPVGP